MSKKGVALITGISKGIGAKTAMSIRRIKAIY